MPAARAASTRSSPSQTNSPSFSRCRRDPSSRRISFSFVLCADVITASSRARRRGSRRARRTRARAPGYSSIRMPQPCSSPRGLPAVTNATGAGACSSVDRTAARVSSERYGKTAVWKTSVGRSSSTRRQLVARGRRARAAAGSRARRRSRAQAARAARPGRPRRSTRAGARLRRSSRRPAQRSMPTRRVTRGATPSNARRNRRALLAPLSRSGDPSGPHSARRVRVAIAVPDEVQARARPELDDVQLVDAEQLAPRGGSRAAAPTSAAPRSSARVCVRTKLAQELRVLRRAGRPTTRRRRARGSAGRRAAAAARPTRARRRRSPRRRGRLRTGGRGPT